MKKDELENKILGCLSMVAIGDALGMPTHDLTSDEISRRFGGPVRDFHPPGPDSRVHPRHRAAEITDDTLLTLAAARSYLEGRGRVDPLSVARGTAAALARARESGREMMFGPSTRRCVEALEAGLDPLAAALAEKHPLSGASNGGAMKVSPAGLVHPGDLEAAAADALTICLPSHATVAGVSAAAAIAAGVAEAVTPRADVYSVAQACLWGAAAGERLAVERVRRTPLPSLPERIKLAIQLVLTAGDPVAANRRLVEVIGAGLAAYESVPAAIGVFLANGGVPEKCVLAGANIGYDTDTIASLAGALSGALHGFAGVPVKWYERVVEVNGLDLAGLARDLADLASGAGGGS
ncbi:MAG: ADP-ribosylglycohydrolase family protein [Pseudomonadota bacterium]